MLHLGTNSVDRGALSPEIVADARKLVTRMLGLMPRLYVAVPAILPRADNTFPDAPEPRLHPDELNRVALRNKPADGLSRDGLHLSPRGGRVLSRYFLDSVAALSDAPVDPTLPAPAV